MNAAVWRLRMSNLLATGCERSYRIGVPVAAALSVILALMARTVIDHAPQYDELLHFLAARGLLEHGVPVIADGQYLRAFAFTRLVALSMQLFGDNLVVARIPAVAGAAALVFATSLFATRQAGWIAGVSAGLVLCAVPLTIDLAVFSRFYTIHAALVLLAAIAGYAAIAPGRSRFAQTGLALLSLVFLVLAMDLQLTTAIAVGALASAVAATVIFDNWSRVQTFVRDNPILVAVAAVALATLCLFVASALGLLHEMRRAPLWAQDSVSKLHYYVPEFSTRMPLIWPLFPLAIVFAVRGQPRLTIFCSVFFAAAFIAHSVAAAKAVRYVYYILPFLSVVYGCAVSFILSAACRSESGAREAKPANAIGVALLVGGLMLVLSVEGRDMGRLIVGHTDPTRALSYGGEPDWNPTLPQLKPLLATANRVVTSSSMKAIYYFGRYDYEISQTSVQESATHAEFGIDERTGRHAISTPQSIVKVLDMPEPTLIVLETRSVGRSGGVSTPTMSVITQRCTSVPLPREVSVLAWRC